MRTPKSVSMYQPVDGLAGYGYVAETAALAMTAYSIWGKKPKVNVDVPIYSSQPPPPTYVNWTPTIVLVGIAAIGLTMIATSKK
jgi:uncharacterized membrane protein